MGSRYSNLSIEERTQIQLLHEGGCSCRAIAQQLRRAPTTIVREIARNGGLQSGYWAARAQQRCTQRRAGSKRAQRKLGARFDSLLGMHVRRELAQCWSPQQIAGRLRAMPVSGLGCVSHESIYRAIYVLPRAELRSALIVSLRRAHTKRMPRARGQDRASVIANVVSIHQRPAEADSRTVPGHWEADFIKGAFNRSAVGTMIERTSRKVLLAHMSGCTAEDALAGFTRRLNTVPAALRKTFAYDCGVEMTLHEQLHANTGIAVYFCDPHSPWQRACNENLNGLVRQFLPKSTDLSQVSPQMLFHIEELLNNRPRAILDFKTPNEVYRELINKIQLPMPDPLLPVDLGHNPPVALHA